MTKKILMTLIAAAFVLGSGLDVFAFSKPIESVVRETDAAEGPVSIRYFKEGHSAVNPNAAVCPTGLVDPAGGRYCEINHTNKPNKGKVGYKGTLEDIFNWDGNYGLYMGAWDTEFGTGTPDHKGYYAWVGQNVADTDQDDLWAAGCVGVKSNNTCLGAAEPANSAGTEIANTTQGIISPWGGLRPIPVPKPSATTDPLVIQLDWTAVSVIGVAPADPVQYDLYYVANVGGSCAAPTADAYTFLKTVTGTSTTVSAADLGIGDQDSAFFALKIRYPGPTSEVLSRYLSANSQCVGFGAFDVQVVDLSSRYVGRNNIEVNWRTELEDGVVGFYVTRSFTQNGPYQRVSSLIPAKGEPSSYSFIDAINTRAPRGSGVFYTLEVVDIDDAITTVGPTATELPNLNPGVVPKKFERPIRRR
ncbi:MAG: hypothetical protein Q9Q40_14915 [Acidobacteriota bacterium]|nr:hypothetical protein [Acidobacteriota bacterium]